MRLYNQQVIWVLAVTFGVVSCGGDPSGTDGGVDAARAEAGRDARVDTGADGGDSVDANLADADVSDSGSPTLKAHYGHYMATRYGDTTDDVVELCETPGITGVVWRRTWKEVEPSAGVYDFSSFESVLEAIAGSSAPNCRLWLFVEFKSFPASRELNPCPVYLQAEHSAPNANNRGSNRGSTCFMWEPVVRDAYNNMVGALGARFDGEANVEGVILQESALGFRGAFSQSVADGGTYTPEAWRDSLIDIIEQCTVSFPTSRCTSFLNFLEGGQRYLYDISAAIGAIPNDQACFAGPDLLPDNRSLYNNMNSVYEVLVRHDGCRANSAQNDSYGVAGCDMSCIFDFAVSGTFGDFDQDSPRDSGVCVNTYLFWNHRVAASATGLNWTDSLPVIQANPHGPLWTDRCIGAP